jgi:hypothetical protein
MKYIHHYVVFTCLLLALSPLGVSAAEEAETYTLASQRQVGSLDRVNIQLDAVGELLTKSDSSEKPDRQKVGLSCQRDYDEKTLHLPTEADKSLRGVRFYREASATLKKAAAVQSPKIRPENRLVALEITGQKETAFSPKGPFSLDELDLVTTIGESLCLDQLLPGKPVKIGETWKLADETVCLLLGLEETTSNSLQVAFKAATVEFARLELSGKVTGNLYGAESQITLAAKCRFDRHTGRIDWLAMRLTQNREIGVVEDGLDWTVLVKITVNGPEASPELSDTALADFSLTPTDELTRVQYLEPKAGYQLTHDRLWYLVGRTRNFEEFHRLDHGRDIGMCKITPQPQVSPAKLPDLRQFQGIVQDLLHDHLSEIQETSQAETPGHLRILRVKAKGKEGELPVRWNYYLVSDPEGRQIVFAFRIEEKRLEDFGKADEAFVHSLRFVEKKELAK